VLAAALQTVVVPFVGLWVDKIGQIPIMIGAAVLFAVTAYPAFALLGANASLLVLVLMVCWLGLLKSFFSGALPSLMAKVFPTSTRVSGMSLSYNIAVAVFGGFAPFFASRSSTSPAQTSAELLRHRDGIAQPRGLDRAAPALSALDDGGGSLLHLQAFGP